MLFYYFIILIIILILLFKIYIRIRHSFWSIQPVVHSYNIFKLFYKNGIIQNELPSINKFCDFLNIKTFNFSELSQTDKININKFICENYLIHKFSSYNPSLKFFESCFSSHNCNSYISIYNESFNLLNKYSNNSNEIITNNIDGIITCRPVNLTLKNLTKFPVYYIDFLCIHQTKRKKGLAPKLIQTHEYNQRHLNKNIQVSLFKREGELVGIIPLVIFKNCFYNISTDLTISNYQTNSQIKYVDVNKNNFYLFINFIINYYYLFDCVAIVEPSNILELILANHLFIIIGILNGNIISSFIFRDFNLTYNSEKVIELSNSLIKPDFENNIIELFSNSLSFVNKKLLAKHLSIESISHNSLLLDKLNKINVKPNYISNSAYFLYNYSQTPILPNKCFIFI